MKKSSLLVLLFAWAMVSCSSNEPFLNDSDQKEGSSEEMTPLYLSLDLYTGENTRAQLDGYQDGTEQESHISNVRFYFFTGAGTPAFVEEEPSTWQGQPISYRSYIDFKPAVQNVQSADNNVERIVTTDLTIFTNETYKEKIPAMVMAVVNPTGLGNANMSLDELQEKVADYATSDYVTNLNFLMSSAVYLDENGSKVGALNITNHLHPTEAEAMSDRVSMYVERVVARLDLSIGMNPLSANNRIYDTGVEYEVTGADNETITYNGNIYVKFLGWNLTSTPDKSRLIKEISTSWAPALFGNSSSPWNMPERHRSLWAINPEDVDFRYGNFGQGLPGNNITQGPTSSSFGSFDFEPSGTIANALPFGEGNKPVSVYLQENAADPTNAEGFGTPNRNTKVILAAQLVQDDGKTPITLVEWDLEYFTINGLRNKFANEAGLYKRTKGATGTKFTKITPADITFATAGSLDNSIMNPDATGRYYNYPQLVADPNVEWATSDDQNAPTISFDAANNSIKDKFGKVSIWNAGFAYYYFDIFHLGENNFPGRYGIVRNHIYKAVINSVKSLGTPVYNPDEVIYPERPEDNSIIVADIKVLTWRIVNKLIKLQW